MKLKKRNLIIAETILLVASVFVFRSLWLLIDMIPTMHTPRALVISLAISITVTAQVHYLLQLLVPIVVVLGLKLSLWMK